MANFFSKFLIYAAENVEPKIRIHGFSVPAENFAGKILAFLYRHIRVAKFFDKNSIYIAQNRISFAINIQGMTKRPFAERSRSEQKTAVMIFHSLKIYFQKESF
ncbi:MAG: hypothetical protein IJM48_08615, partial [Treponema sp.]|nr:hypothetical protein [Treponema sp.]